MKHFLFAYLPSPSCNEQFHRPAVLHSRPSSWLPSTSHPFYPPRCFFRPVYQLTRYAICKLTRPFAHSVLQYLMVCTLTVAAWDTLVLSPRTWRLMKTNEWPLLKISYHILRYLMPVEFTIVAVAFFDSKWSAAVSSLITSIPPSLNLNSSDAMISIFLNQLLRLF